MADNNEILIDVQVDTQRMQQELSAAIQSVAALKDEQKRLTKEIENGNDANGEMAKQLAAVKQNIEENNRTIKNHTALLQVEGQQVVSNNMSLDEQRRVLNTLQKAYGQLSGEEKKNADMSGGLRDQIKQLTDSIRDQEHALGDDRRNVGNYAESIKKAIPDLGKMKGAAEAAAGGTTTLSRSLDSADKMMKGFIANPFFGTIFLLGGALNLIGAALKKNEKAMDGVQKLTAGIGASLDQLKPILDWLMNFLVDSLLKAINWVMDAVRKAFSWIDKLAAKFGKNLGLSGAFDAGAAAAKNLGDKADEATGKVETLAERMKRLHDEAFKAWLIEEQWREDQAATLDILTHKSKQAEEAAQKALDAQKKALDLFMKYNNNEEEEEGDELESFDSMARRWFGLDSEAVEHFKQLLADGVDYAEAKLLTLKDQQTRNIQAMGAAMGELGASFSDLSDDLSQFGEENKAAAAAAKAFSMTAIIANQAQSMTEGALAIAAGVRKAQSVPFPANLAAIAITVATITGVLASTVSSIAQAKSVLKGTQAFESGGVIGGYTSNPSRHDDTYIHAANGEMVLTASQQRKLFEIANGSQSSAFESSVAAMTAAIAAMPAPVLEYTEFKQFEQKTTTIQEIARV